MSEKIFISIISCKEHFIEQTVLSALNNAKNPENIYIGIFNTVIDNDPLFINIENVKVVNFYCKNPMGIGFSRKKATEICPEDTTYILQIDAHMLFENNWDESLIKNIKNIEIKTKNKKNIISSFLNNWIIDENKNITINEKIIFDIKNIEMDYFLSPINIKYRWNSNQTYPQTWGYELDSWKEDDFFEISSVSGNFVFSRKELFDQIKYDERGTWGSDEGIFAMRAWTRGYKIYTIKNKIAYHLNKDVMKDKLKSDWRNNAEGIVEDEEIENKKVLNFKIIKNIYTGKELGEFGSPNIKLLKEYEKFCDFNFSEYYKNLDEMGVII